MINMNGRRTLIKSIFQYHNNHVQTYILSFLFQCVQYVDPEVLSQLIPRINDLIRSGIGVGTKVGIQAN